MHTLIHDTVTTLSDSTCLHTLLEDLNIDGKVISSGVFYPPPDAAINRNHYCYVCYNHENPNTYFFDGNVNGDVSGNCYENNDVLTSCLQKSNKTV